MPNYDYRCEACSHEFETFQSIKAKPLKKCPKCSANRLKRLIGTGGGFIFKGPGFYATDYRKPDKKKDTPDGKPPESCKKCPKDSCEFKKDDKK